ncbi:MAG TPA: DUF4142 domain-containing protein, partial [Chthoniobacteraceae bacterium]
MRTSFFAPAVLALTLALAAPSSAFAADDSANAGKPAGGLSLPEEKFIMKAAQAGMTAVQLGQLAEQKGARADVKKFGQQMATEHGKANAELTALASRRSVAVPTQLDQIHAGSVDRLSKLEGDQFDRAYIEEMAR